MDSKYKALEKRLGRLVARICRRFRPAFWNTRNEIVLVYTSSKVGSSSVYNSLKKAHPWMPVEHIHFLSESVLGQFREEGKWLNNLERADQVTLALSCHASKNKILITLVRDPVARDISAMFQSWDVIFGTDKFSEVTDRMVLDHLYSSSFNQTEHWFQTEFKEYTGINVLDLPFDKKKGYSIQSVGDYKILLLKLEVLSEVYQESIRELLGTKRNVLENHNLTSKKKSAVMYQNIKNSLRLNQEKLSEIYSSEFLNHFYTREELDRFILKWGRGY